MLVRIATMSGEDSVAAEELAGESRLEVVEHATGTWPMVLDVERDSLAAAVFLSEAERRGIQFDDVSWFDDAVRPSA